MGTGAFSLIARPLLALALRRNPPAIAELTASEAATAQARGELPLGFSPGSLQGLLCVSGIACCVAMSMPQVHMVAYCADLGFPAARGAEMLALMIGVAIVTRLASGWIADRIGGLRTLLLGAVLHATPLPLLLPS